MPTTTIQAVQSTLTEDQLRQAREWLAENDWADVDADFEWELISAPLIERGIAYHFDGGLAAFIATCDPDHSAADRAWFFHCNGF